MDRNCGWVSPKAAAHFLFHKILGPEKGQQTYKKFTEYARERIKTKYNRLKGPKIRASQ